MQHCGFLNSTDLAIENQKSQEQSLVYLQLMFAYYCSQQSCICMLNRRLSLRAAAVGLSLHIPD